MGLWVLKKKKHWRKKFKWKYSNQFYKRYRFQQSCNLFSSEKCVLCMVYVIKMYSVEILILSLCYVKARLKTMIICVCVPSWWILFRVLIFYFGWERIITIYFYLFFSEWLLASGSRIMCVHSLQLILFNFNSFFNHICVLFTPMCEIRLRI